jgi:hypothetical protein
VSRPTLDRPTLNGRTRQAQAALRAGLTVAVLAGACAGIAGVRGTQTSTDQPAQALDVLRSASQNISAAGPPPAGSGAAEVAAAEPRTTAARDSAQAAAAQRAQAARRAAAERAARSAARDPRSAARPMLADLGWGSGQFQCLDSLWMKESGWDPTARNSSSGAFGLAQALPGNKMASAGPDWQTNPLTQIRWGLGYIKSVYGSPCGAWAHSRATNWY